MQSDKEIALSLCKMCLNAKLLFDPIMSKAKKDGNVNYNPITEYLRSCCDSPKTVNRYCHWKCVSGKCKSCKDLGLLPLKYQISTDTVKVSQFKVTKICYKQVDKDTGKIID